MNFKIPKLDFKQTTEVIVILVLLVALANIFGLGFSLVGYPTNDLVGYWSFDDDNKEVGLVFDGTDDYIDLGLTFGSTTIVSIDGSIDPYSTSASKILGSSNGGYAWIGASSSGASAYFYAGTGGSTFSTFSLSNVGQRVIMEFDNVDDEVSVNSEVKPIIGTISGGWGILIGTQSPNNDPNRYIKTTVYNVQVEQGGSLVRNLVAKTNGCFQDLVNDVEYCNLGAGDLSISDTVVYDASSNNNDGELVGSALIIDEELSLDGSGAVALIDSDSLGIGSDLYSISVFFNANSIDSDCTGSLNRLVTLHKGTPSTGIALGVMCSDELGFIYHDGTVHQTISYGAINTNEWYMQTVTYDGTDYRLYLNGILDQTVTDGNLMFSDSTAYIGDFKGDYGWGFNGLIDDVFIYNRVISDAEVMDLYLKKSEPSCSDGVQNQDEEGVDCGGSSCVQCSNGVVEMSYDAKLENDLVIENQQRESMSPFMDFICKIPILNMISGCDVQ